MHIRNGECVQSHITSVCNDVAIGDNITELESVCNIGRFHHSRGWGWCFNRNGFIIRRRRQCSARRRTVSGCCVRNVSACIYIILRNNIGRSERLCSAGCKINRGWRNSGQSPCAGMHICNDNIINPDIAGIRCEVRISDHIANSNISRVRGCLRQC